MSGTLWDVLFDPVVRFLAAKIEYKFSRVSAYADDLAMILHNLWMGLPLLARALAAVAVAARLELNFDNAVIAPLFRLPLQRVRDRIREVCVPHLWRRRSSTTPSTWASSWALRGRSIRGVHVQPS